MRDRPPPTMLHRLARRVPLLRRLPGRLEEMSARLDRLESKVGFLLDEVSALRTATRHLTAESAPARARRLQTR